MRRSFAFLAPLLFGAITSTLALEPCRIEVVEKGSGWPVPLVELRTTHAERFITDNAGVIAFDLPESMGHETWFDIIGHGYGVPKDGFGFRGVRLVPEPGKTVKVEVERQIVAKRMGRITGTGLFAESQKTGRELAWSDPRISGCDSVLTAVYRGKLFWAWGDTMLPRYPLGIYDTTSAMTPVQPLASFTPPLRLKLDYFADAKGQPRGVAKMPGNGPTWLSAYTTLFDKAGTPHLVATYVKIKNHLDVYERGLCVWNDATSSFDQHHVLWRDSDGKPAPPAPDGHPALWKDAEGK